MTAGELTLPSGVVVPVSGRLATRSLPDDPLDLPARVASAPNPNPAVGSVGPNVPPAGDASAQQGASGGFGATHVMYPAGTVVPQAWAGWPVGWDVPSSWDGWTQWTGDVDIAFAAMDLNARVVADMPWYVSDPSGVRVPDPPPWLRNPQPEVYTHRGEFITQCWMSLQAVGEVFVIATSRYADGYPRTFMMLNPMYVSVDILDGRRSYTIAGQDVPDGDLLHIRYQSWPGDAHGHSPLEVAGLKATAIKVLDRYGTDLASNGGIPWGVLQYKGRLTPTQVAEIRSQWIQAAQTRMGAPAITDQDATLHELQVVPKDMALVEQLERLESRVAVLLGVPPYLLSLVQPGSSSMTYANASEWFRQHWRTTLRPLGRKLARALNQWLLPVGRELEIDPAAYIQNDLVSRAQYYDTMLRNDVMTVAEVRQAEGIFPAEAPAAAPPPPHPNADPIERPAGGPR